MAELCLNFCEVLTAAMLKDDKLFQIIDAVPRKDGEKPIKRIYSGSSFCSQYFMHINYWEKLCVLCRENGWQMTLTLPVFSQKDLERAKTRMEDVLSVAEEVIDEVTVNDVGMLRYFSGHYDKKMNLGRLFFKDPRDVRIREYAEGTMTPNLLTFGKDRLPGAGVIGGVELDEMSRQIDLGGCDLEGLSLSVHEPFCYMTTGNICKYASIPLEPEQKFRPNTGCFLQCAVLYEHYRERFGDKNADMLRFGRTVYYLNDTCEIMGKPVDRILYFPVREVNEVMQGGDGDENSGSAQSRG